jgi:hypothetical protein
MKHFAPRTIFGIALVVTVVVLARAPQPARAATADEIDSSATVSLENLYASSDAARLLAKKRRHPRLPTS